LNCSAWPIEHEAVPSSVRACQTWSAGHTWPEELYDVAYCCFVVYSVLLSFFWNAAANIFIRYWKYLCHQGLVCP